MNPSPRIVRRADRRAVAWANGLGATEEIAADLGPEGAIRWRLSVATLRGHSEFSPLPGLDRVFTVVRGSGVTLDFSGSTVRAQALTPTSFDGGDPPACSVGDETAEAFNVMVDRATLTAYVAVECYGSGGGLDPVRTPPSTVTAAVVLAGTLLVEDRGVLGAGDCVLFENMAGVVEPGPETTVVWVRIDGKRARS